MSVRPSQKHPTASKLVCHNTTPPANTGVSQHHTASKHWCITTPHRQQTLVYHTTPPANIGVSQHHTASKHWCITTPQPPANTGVSQHPNRQHTLVWPCSPVDPANTGVSQHPNASKHWCVTPSHRQQTLVCHSTPPPANTGVSQHPTAAAQFDERRLQQNSATCKQRAIHRFPDMCWDSFFFFSVPSYTSGVHQVSGDIFAYMAGFVVVCLFFFNSNLL